LSRPDRPPRGGEGARPRDLAAVRSRKRELARRCAEQRDAMAAATEGLAPVFAAGDRVASVGRSILSHKWLLAAAAGLLVALRPRSALSAAGRLVPMASRGFALWSALRSARRVLGQRG
jgi:hypothetical protein